MSVLISGATGFIAQHIVNDLLKQNYKVIGTVRSQEKADKLKKQFGNNPNLTLELVADIAAPNAFDHVLEKHGADVKVVLHTASPFFVNSTEYEKDLLTPAVNGTKSILESIKKYAADSVERVVVTSSFAAMLNLEKNGDESVVYTEESWNPATWESCQVNGTSAYCGSKKLAEAAAWEFLRENRQAVKFQLSTVNPVYVFGPQLFDEDVKDTLNTSCEFINALIHNKPEAKQMQEFRAFYIDVRDVSKAHLIAFQKKEAIGKRLLLTNGQFAYQDLEDIVNEDFPQLKGKILVGNPGSGKEAYKTMDSIDNTKTREILGYPFRSLKETVDDTAAQILKKDGNL
ncbi:hypothetical protein HG536_0B07030 [Torulaspora globosa]|uniref:NAD-dependent epimerase/dehydratase domain-containing protein n=1 Tax=Torulaspora globosa TaxID=48254 RepID=A0A7G3ZE99_9SACH|nr:uncharacterized protein HG536_0B07030 [Torulaspora globosa]QLL31835.1 hypothetical protein HG536_0B07030 [Torulaspora globosa]